MKGSATALRFAAGLAVFLFVPVAAPAQADDVDEIDIQPAEALREEWDSRRRILYSRLEQVKDTAGAAEEVPLLRLELADLSLRHGFIRYAFRNVLIGMEASTAQTSLQTRLKLLHQAACIAIVGGHVDHARTAISRMESLGARNLPEWRPVLLLLEAEIAGTAQDFPAMAAALNIFAGEVTRATEPRLMSWYWIQRTWHALYQGLRRQAARYLQAVTASPGAEQENRISGQILFLEALLAHKHGATDGEVTAILWQAHAAFQQDGFPGWYPLMLAKGIEYRDRDSLHGTPSVLLEAIAEFADEAHNQSYTGLAYAARAELLRRDRRFETAHAALEIGRRKDTLFEGVMISLLSRFDAAWMAWKLHEPAPPQTNPVYYLLILSLLLVLMVLLLALRVRTQRLVNAQLRELVQKSRVAEQVAEEANRTKSQFLANVSHEIKNPMAGLVGMASLLDELVTDPAQRRCLDTVNACAQNLLVIVNDLLDLGRMESGRIEIDRSPFRLADTLRYCHELAARPARAKGLELLIEQAPDMPDQLVGDATRINQILVNLMNNAIKFTETGTVAVRARFQRTLGTAGLLVIDVIDTGIGIPPEKLPAIFEPFSQAHQETSRRQDGSGLGLAISHKLVELMSGTLTVVSRPGTGSTFTVTLPVTV